MRKVMLTSHNADVADSWPAGALAIMRVAEQLMGRHGIEGVSMRQITRAAEMANNSAIAYHFGDRDGLLRSISRWRAGPITQERERLYALAERDGALDCPRQIVRIITRPVLIVRNPDGSHTHAAFVSQMLKSRLGREIRKIVSDSGSAIIGDLVRRLKLHAKDLPQDLFEFRLRMGSLAFYEAVIERDDMAIDDPAWLSADDDAFLAELDEMMLAVVLRSPAA